MNTTSANQRSDTFFERHAWKMFLGLSLLIVVFGLGDIFSGAASFQSGEAPTMQGITGMTWQELEAASPGAATFIDFLARSGGAHLLTVGLFSAVVSLTSFRHGERLAWYGMWIWPLWIALFEGMMLNSYKTRGPSIPPPLISGPVFFSLSVLTLGLSYRKFFRQSSPIA